MDPRERLGDPQEALRAALDGRQASIHTALPGIVQSFNAEVMTAVVQPSIMYQVRDLSGNWNNAKAPLLLDCPVHFPSGGGFTLTFPVGAGDEVLVVLSERCIDAWWQSGGVQPQAEFRMHDLSDGFVIPKVWSKPKVLSGISTTSTQLRNDAGTCFLDLSSTKITLQAPDGSKLVLGAGEAALYGTTYAALNGAGTGIKYSACQIDDYTTSASSTPHACGTEPTP